MKWVVAIVLFVALDLAIYAWLHRDMEERLHSGLENVSSQVLDLGRIQERVMFQR